MCYCAVFCLFVLTLHFFTVPSSIASIQNETVPEGGTVTLSCNASGIPSPMVSWFKADGQRIDQSELVLTHINRSEAGEYRCEASNECGNASETATIDVQCKFFFLTFYMYVNYIINLNLKFYCMYQTFYYINEVIIAGKEGL